MAAVHLLCQISNWGKGKGGQLLLAILCIQYGVIHSKGVVRSGHSVCCFCYEFKELVVFYYESQVPTQPYTWRT
jgi:hypothetical protein